MGAKFSIKPGQSFRVGMTVVRVTKATRQRVTVDVTAPQELEIIRLPVDSPDDPSIITFKSGKAPSDIKAQ